MQALVPALKVPFRHGKYFDGILSDLMESMVTAIM